MKKILLSLGVFALGIAAGLVFTSEVSTAGPVTSSPATSTSSSYAPTVKATCTDIRDSTNSIVCAPKLNPDIESGASGDNF